MADDNKATPEGEEGAKGAAPKGVVNPAPYPEDEPGGGIFSPSDAADLIKGAWGALPSAGEVGKLITNSVHHAAQEAGRTIDEAARAAGPWLMGAGGVEAGIGVTPEVREAQQAPVEPSTFTIPAPEPVEHPATKFLLPVGQFVAGMAGVGKILRPLEIGRKATTMGAVSARIAWDSVRAGTVGAVAFDPMERRLSNTIAENVEMGRFITEFLQADEGDTVAEARFKSFLENAALGAGVDAAFFLGARAIRRWKKGLHDDAVNDLSAADEASQKAIAEAEAEARVGRAGASNDNAGPLGPEPLPGEPQLRIDTTPPPRGRAANDAFVGREGDTLIPLGEEAGVVKNTARHPIFSQEQMDQVADRIMGNIRALENDPFSPLDPAGFVIPREVLIGGDAALDETLHALGSAVKSRMEMEGLSGTQRIADLQAKAVYQLRQIYGARGVDGLIERMNQVVTAAEEIPVMLMVMRELSTAAGNKVAAISAAHATTGLTEAARQELFEAASLTTLLMSGDEQIMSAMGRGMRVSQESTKVTSPGKLGSVIKEWAAGVKKQWENLTPAEETQLMETINALPKDARGPVALSELVLNGRKKLAGYYVQSVLGITSSASQLITDPVNAFLLMPAENLAAGLSKAARTKATEGKADWSAVTEQGRYLLGVMRTIFDMHGVAARSPWESAAETWRTAKGVLDPHLPAKGDELNYFPEPKLSLVEMVQEGDYASAITGAWLKATGIARRVTATQSEFLQQAVYGGKLYADAVGQAQAQGLVKGTPEFNAAVQESMKAGYGPLGQATKAGELALDMAREATLNQPLPAKSVSAFLQSKARDQAPEVLYVLPFIRSMHNIFMRGYDMSLLKTASNFYHGEFAKGGEAADAAMGQLALAASLASAISVLAYKGYLTDSGPTDPELRKMKEATGWRANSFVKFNEDGTKTYIPHTRLDPLSYHFGAIAGIVNIARAGADGATVDDLAAQAVLTLSKNVTSKTYVQNIQLLMDTINGNDPDKWARLARGTLGGFIPSPLKRMSDSEEQLQLSSIISGIHSSLPGYSSRVDRKFNSLGEVQPVDQGPGVAKVMHPFFSVTSNPDNIDEILYRVAEANKAAFPPPDVKMKLASSPDGSGVNLKEIKTPSGRSLYDRLQELVQRPDPSMPTLRETLRAEIQSDLKYWNTPDARDGYRGQRYAIVREIISSYHKAAAAALLAETPGLQRTLEIDAGNAANVLDAGAEAAVIPVEGKTRKRR